MKKKQKKILIVLIVIVILIVILIMVKIYDIKNNSNKEINNNIELEEIQNDNNFDEMNSFNTYYSVKEIINTYMNSIKEFNGDSEIEFGKLKENKETTIENLQNDAIDNIYDTLADEYVKECNITKEKIKNQISKYKKQGNYTEDIDYNINIKDMYYKSITENLDIVFIEMNIDNYDDDRVILELDKKNSTYMLYGTEYIDKYQYNKNTDINILKINREEIEEKNYNIFQVMNVDNKYIVNQLFLDYQKNMKNQIELAYSLLDDDYKNKKFGEINNFKKYIQENNEIVENAALSKYMVNQYEDYTEYVCIDDIGRYYIFILKTPINYKVLLDTYTVDLNEFIEKYNSGDERDKVGMNIEKIKNAINDKDYEYVYSKLNENFKKNKFNNEENLSEYLKKNLYDQNEIEYLDFKQEGNIYIYNIKIKSNSNEEKNATIVMNLLQNTDFEMSFSID